MVDLAKASRNAAAMRARAARSGLALRAHVKTHKTREGWELQRPERGGGGMVVSTLAEAAFFAPVCSDMIYGVPIAPDKIADAAELMERHEGLSMAVMVDSAEAAEALADDGRRFRTHLKLDTGYGRAGVDPLSDDAIRLAGLLASGRGGVTLDGLYSHSGHSYACEDADQVLGVAREECAAVTAFAARMAKAGLRVPDTVGVGSTPVCSVIDALTPDEIGAATEMHPGNYLFYDAQQASTGVCRLEQDVAATVLCQSVGVYPDRGRVLLDAGSLALSKDTAPGDGGFGRVAGHPGLRLVTCSQEVAAVEGDGVCELLPLGARARVLVNHSCLAAACFDRYHVVSGDDVVAEWHPTRGWDI